MMTKREGWGMLVLIALLLGVVLNLQLYVNDLHIQLTSIQDGADVLEVSTHGYVKFRNWEVMGVEEE